MLAELFGLDAAAEANWAAGNDMRPGSMPARSGLFTRPCPGGATRAMRPLAACTRCDALSYRRADVGSPCTRRQHGQRCAGMMNPAGAFKCWATCDECAGSGWTRGMVCMRCHSAGWRPAR